MTFTHRDYCQYLLNAQGNYTLTHLAEHLQSLSHDTINWFLSKKPLNSADLWANVRPSLSLSDEASIVFYDTVLERKSSRKIELVRRQYSGNEHRVINFLKRWSNLTLKTIYQLKTEWISFHLVQELKTLSIRLELV